MSHHLSNHEVEQLVRQRVVWTPKTSHGVLAGLGDDARRPVHLPAQTHTHTTQVSVLTLQLPGLLRLYIIIVKNRPNY